MSFERLSSDSCSYEQKLRESIGPGAYQLGTPANDCTPCARDVPTDPYIRYQSFGPGICPPGSSIDTNSDLIGITRKASKCAADQYLPSSKPVGNVCAPKGQLDCRPGTEPTRLSNPPCTIKETGYNRWEDLCWNPQDRAIIPFEWNTSYRMVAKDNHTPCIPNPIDQSIFFPTAAIQQPTAFKSTGEQLPSQQTGVSCQAIGKM